MTTGALDGYPEAGTAEQRVEWLKARLLAIHDEARARMAAVEARQIEVERRIAVYEERLAEQERRLDEIEARLEAARGGEPATAADRPTLPPTRH